MAYYFPLSQTEFIHLTYSNYTSPMGLRLPPLRIYSSQKSYLKLMVRVTMSVFSQSNQSSGTLVGQTPSKEILYTSSNQFSSTGYPRQTSTFYLQFYYIPRIPVWQLDMYFSHLLKNFLIGYQQSSVKVTVRVSQNSNLLQTLKLNMGSVTSDVWMFTYGRVTLVQNIHIQSMKLSGSVIGLSQNLGYWSSFRSFFIHSLRSSSKRPHSILNIFLGQRVVRPRSVHIGI